MHALILYDIQDEKDRNKSERPYPFIDTIDPFLYNEKYLNELKLDKIIYRCVGKYSDSEFNNLLNESHNNSNLVFAYPIFLYL